MPTFRLNRATQLAATVTLLFSLSARPVGTQVSDSLAKRIDAIFANYASTTSPGCIVGIGRDGRQVYARAYGMANLEYAVPLTTESISESGSVAKQFTAAALALLHLEGVLSLDDDIRKYLPEVPDFGQRITIRHLLTHTSGIRDQWAMWGLAGRGPGSEVHTIAEVLDMVSRQRQLNFPTGSEYLYSNTGYTLASVIVTRVAGMPFARFTEERIFKPLGMTHTQWRDDYRRVVPQRATAYSRQDGAWIQDMPFTMVHGNGGLLTTVADLLAWNRALDGGLLGRPELTRLLETQGKLANGRRLDYALGLTITYARGGGATREVAHGGSTAGYRTFLARYPERGRLAVALLCNAANANAAALARRVAGLFLDAVPEVAADSSPPPVPADQRVRVAATYRNPVSDESFSIAGAGEGLRLTGGQPLMYDSPGVYRTRSSARLRFEPAEGAAAAQHLTWTDSSGAVTLYERAATPSLASAQLEEYAGDYFSPELGSRLRLRVEKERLLLRATPDDELALRPFYRDGFRVGSTGTTVRFVRAAGGEIIELRAFAGRARNVLFERVPVAR
ncbi:MAG: serine hydrolase domain-containing protein [Gemmatimonadaceae bacterium]